MALPDPEIGLVVHFNYLWKREQAEGRENARYARPCAVVLAHRQRSDGVLLVVVAPITHSEPIGDTVAVEMPAKVKRHLGLDEARSWIVVDEVNEFVWPGFDLQPNAKGDFAYGVIPNALYGRVRDRVLECARHGRLDRVQR